MTAEILRLAAVTSGLGRGVLLRERERQDAQVGSAAIFVAD